MRLDLKDLTDTPMRYIGALTNLRYLDLHEAKVRRNGMRRYGMVWCMMCVCALHSMIIAVDRSVTSASLTFVPSASSKAWRCAAVASQTLAAKS